MMVARIAGMGTHHNVISVLQQNARNLLVEHFPSRHTVRWLRKVHDVPAVVDGELARIYREYATQVTNELSVIKRNW